MYKLSATGSYAQRLSDGVWVPVNEPKNRDSRKYATWVDEGNTAQAADKQPAPQKTDNEIAIELLLKVQKGEVLTVDELAERDRILTELEKK